MNRHTLSILILALLSWPARLFAQDLQILNISPAPNLNHVEQGSIIEIEFDQAIDGAALNEETFIVRGSLDGPLEGDYSGGGSATATFTPAGDFRPGERITLTLTTALLSEDGNGLARGHSYSFTALSGEAAALPVTLAQRPIGGAYTGGREVRAMDYDGDGDLDILSSSEGIPEQINVHENDGAGEYCAYGTGGNFRLLAVFDIDGDGDYDNFGATGAFDTELNWFENEGAPPYTERFISVEDPWTLAGGDLDGDGDADVVAAVIIPNRLLWFANDGVGNFGGANEIPTTFGGGSDSYFYLRDINSDGAMDILAFHRDDFNLVWYENDGNQVFTEHLVLDSPNRGRLASGDLDDDGDVDIVFVSTDSNPTLPIAWFENDGAENFTQHDIAASSTGRLYTADIADLDGDQDMDILAGGYWFENDGEQNFGEAPLGGLGLDANQYANGIHAADLDGDDDLDLVVLGLYTTSWYENNAFLQLVLTSPANGEDDAAGDTVIRLEFDQAVDMATANSEAIRVLSRYAGPVEGSFSSDGQNTLVFDPLLDFAPGDRIEVSVNEGLLSTGGWNLGVTQGFEFRVATAPIDPPDILAHPLHTHEDNVTGLDVADMDGDGDLDLVSCTWSELLWHENDGDASFTAHPITISGTPVNLLALDHNVDGYMDIWVDNSGYSLSTVYLNDGLGNFTETTVTGALRIRQAADLNRDGEQDVLFLGTGDGQVSWITPRCGTYSGYGSVPAVPSKDVTAGDLDHDGDADFVSATTQGPVSFENDGYAFFRARYMDSNNTKNVTLGDLDGDGDLDPAFTENFASVVWYENRLDEPSADFGPEQGGASIADGPVAIRSGDLDGDGDLDLATISEGDDELIWFENTGSPSAVDDPAVDRPLRFALRRNVPNPFNPVTSIEFVLPEAGPANLGIYNLAGQAVATLVNGWRGGGLQRVSFNAGGLSSGVYFYSLRAGGRVETRKMLLVR